MKMFGQKSLSLYLFYTTRILFWGISGFLLFIVVSLLSGNFMIDDGVFNIAIPFTSTFVKGVYKWNVLTTILLSLTFYGLFFYLLSLIFKTFKAKILFTQTAIRLLNYFVVLNLLIVPVCFILIQFVIMDNSIYDTLSTLILHILLGIFALFIIAVFKHGYEVQQENDLTI